jgi:hypothetical protein
MAGCAVSVALVMASSFSLVFNDTYVLKVWDTSEGVLMHTIH